MRMAASASIGRDEFVHYEHTTMMPLNPVISAEMSRRRFFRLREGQPRGRPKHEIEVVVGVGMLAVYECPAALAAGFGAVVRFRIRWC
jgi:hypothetical protein